ncbi:MAG: hypothetical protein FJ148_28650 [Deltaproteobacteria bacterium]|nr:hypothetical protein [Deltaproteobacteria bacterium]
MKGPRQRRGPARASRRCGRRALLHAVGLLVAIVASRPLVAAALTLAPMTLEQLTGNAALVVRARCIDRSVTRSDDGRIESLARFEVVARAKGEGPEVVAVHQLGGRSGDAELVVPGAPLSEPGDDVVLFLEPRDDGTHGVVGLAIGYLPVVVLPGSGAAVRTSRALGGVFADGGLHSVDELLERVREIASGATPR